MAERGWGESEAGGGLSVPGHDLSGNRQPLPLLRDMVGGKRGPEGGRGWPKLSLEVEAEPGPESRSPQACV